MENKERNYNGKIEIDDLINDAVENALARRSQGLDSEDVLSNEEMKSVAGGIAFPFPILTGIVAYPDETLLS